MIGGLEVSLIAGRAIDNLLDLCGLSHSVAAQEEVDLGGGEMSAFLVVSILHVLGPFVEAERFVAHVHDYKILPDARFVNEKDRALVFPFKVPAIPLLDEAGGAVVALCADIHSRRIVELENGYHALRSVVLIQVTPINFDGRHGMYGKHSSTFQSNGATFLTSDLFQIIRVKDMPVPGAAVSVLIRLKSSHARANEVDFF